MKVRASKKKKSRVQNVCRKGILYVINKRTKFKQNKDTYARIAGRYPEKQERCYSNSPASFGGSRAIEVSRKPASQDKKVQIGMMTRTIQIWCPFSN
jgi:ribosomal protein L36